MFNPMRLELARKRRRRTAKVLAERAGIAPVTYSRLAHGVQGREKETVGALAAALGYPVGVFFLNAVNPIDSSAASVGSLPSISAKDRDAALAAGWFAFDVVDWVNDRFNPPETNLLDLSCERDLAHFPLSLNH